MDKRRVVVTGLGWVTSLGLGVDEVFEKMVAGTSGIGPITKFDTTDFNTKFGGQVQDWDGPPVIEGVERSRYAKKMDRFAQFALNAGVEAVLDSGIDLAKEDPWRCGAIVGSGVGGIEEFADGHEKLLKKGPSRVSPFMVPKLMCNAAAGHLSIHYGIKGPNSAISTACASGAHSIGAARDAIRFDQADVMIAGGAEAALTPLGTSCFMALKALSRRNDDPQAASRPFDVDRDGFVLAEGAGLVVLEEYEHARARGAKIYCELMGFGQTADGTHITAPPEDGHAVAHAMERALRDAALDPEDIDYVNPHATSTPLGDLAETNAIKAVLGESTKTPVSATKSMTGHSLGAAGGIEAVIVAKSLQTGKICPTINLDRPSPGCDLDYVPGSGRDADLKYALSNSFGFGGHNVTLVFGKV
ncbi:beta-ketoacyl-ACP synthase II [Phycisphaera mikurensis]|uniref:3-oxoacyl-[acyl-carrier-protein] synthase 2 n=1 Tax=Phycisphaera mikurensis (strain NBRC 102666 / KCTC 22515 / FYK2301M01) TaxID=1142394 RepID=I0IGP5_PHYMF|nr:beta-ketoacyl-ACP synthase II [Phycisphaera mikurensis]MBB6443224.1 3-oxoacyl-[acyl-carrier-protein] synthase II [Phycisphaera mikurensis]BAM04433.1 3-oxoacyl-[acyl-carrier-protein] synthase II [Phycisphaera mikurensis NBRC 102666]